MPFIIHEQFFYFLEATIDCLASQIALFNTALSIENFNDAMSVPSALGLNPNVANSGKLISSFPQSLVSHTTNFLWMLGFGHGSSRIKP